MQQRCLTEFQLESLQADWLSTRRAQIIYGLIGGLVFGLIFGLSYDHTTAALVLEERGAREVGLSYFEVTSDKIGNVQRSALSDLL